MLRLLRRALLRNLPSPIFVFLPLITFFAVSYVSHIMRTVFLININYAVNLNLSHHGIILEMSKYRNNKKMVLEAPSQITCPMEPNSSTIFV